MTFRQGSATDQDYERTYYTMLNPTGEANSGAASGWSIGRSIYLEGSRADTYNTTRQIAIIGTPATSRVSRASAEAQQTENTPATGAPAISGTVRVGETLTATTEGIEDEDGLTEAVYSYQWVRVDPNTSTETDITGATSSSYTVTAADAGKGSKCGSPSPTTAATRSR